MILPKPVRWRAAIIVLVVLIAMTWSAGTAANYRQVAPSTEPIAVALCLGAVRSQFASRATVNITEVLRFDGLDHVNVAGVVDTDSVNYGWVCKVRDGKLMEKPLVLPRKFRP
jgi:hypothetical protein